MSTACWTGVEVGGLVDRAPPAARVHQHPLGHPAGRPGVLGLLEVYLGEHVAHGWDLAVAIGQPAEVPAGLAERALGSMRIALPDALGRGGPVPFGPVVEPAPEAGPAERLANFLGRPRPA